MLSASLISSFSCADRHLSTSLSTKPPTCRTFWKKRTLGLQMPRTTRKMETTRTKGLAHQMVRVREEGKASKLLKQVRPIPSLKLSLDQYSLCFFRRELSSIFDAHVCSCFIISYCHICLRLSDLKPNYRPISSPFLVRRPSLRLRGSNGFSKRSTSILGRFRPDMFSRGKRWSPSLRSSSEKEENNGGNEIYDMSKGGRTGSGWHSVDRRE